jgi:hypothetical protein
MPNVAFRGCPWNGIFLLLSVSISLSFFFNNNGLVDYVLEVCVEQLELNVTILEHVLFLLIGVDVFRGISRQLTE